MRRCSVGTRRSSRNRQLPGTERRTVLPAGAIGARQPETEQAGTRFISISVSYDDVFPLTAGYLDIV